MTTRWRAYIEKGIRDAGGPVPFALSQWVFLNPIVNTISQSVPRGGRILDVGCGAGVFTALLSHYGYEVVGIDSDPDIVSLAREMVAHFRAPARIEKGSADDLISHHDAFNLVYSLGVVEHFDQYV